MYSAAEIVRVVKRENNKKRGYLVINKQQGKHIPAKPFEIIKMFDMLADRTVERYRDQKVLVIGFAETATAVGARTAVRMDAPYMQTTREDMGNVGYLYFDEEHSHAVEQKLVRTDLDKIVNDLDLILFVEDELTTGNTILNAVKAFKNQYHGISVKFAVASLLNGMTKEAIERFQKAGIAYDYLVKTDHSLFEEAVSAFIPEEDCVYSEAGRGDYMLKEVINMPDARRLINSREYAGDCGMLAQKIAEQAGVGEKILVLGTEEFMYPALVAAEALEEKGNEVFFHATTRSPILPVKALEYPVYSRCRLRSLYDPERKTFIYNVEQYARVFIVTDADSTRDKEGLGDLAGAVKAGGNEKIYVWRWRRV